jgi:hypothetical protein
MVCVLTGTSRQLTGGYVEVDRACRLDCCPILPAMGLCWELRRLANLSAYSSHIPIGSNGRLC